MSISWGKTIQVAPTLWARLGYANNNVLHLMTGAKDDVQQMKGIRYWKIVGRWYMQEDIPRDPSSAWNLVSHHLFVGAPDNCDDIVQMIETSRGT